MLPKSGVRPQSGFLLAIALDATISHADGFENLESARSLNPRGTRSNDFFPPRNPSILQTLFLRNLIEFFRLSKHEPPTIATLLGIFVFQRNHRHHSQMSWQPFSIPGGDRLRRNHGIVIQEFVQIPRPLRCEEGGRRADRVSTFTFQSRGNETRAPGTGLACDV
jgi:hypothetical protein